MAPKQDAPPAYFAGTPAQFQADADMFLQLRGGALLPAHSQLLASTSPVLCDMLKVAASQVPAGSKFVLPLHGWGFLMCEVVDVLKARVHMPSLYKRVSVRLILRKYTSTFSPMNSEERLHFACVDSAVVQSVAQRRSSILRRAARHCRTRSCDVRGRLMMQPCGKPCRWHGGRTCSTQRSTCSALSASSASACGSWSLCGTLVMFACTCTDTAQAIVLRRYSSVLQEELEYHQSTGYDILFECWAVADRLSLHAIAADCEWALAQLWMKKSVYTRAARELTPGALQRIARSLCARIEAAREVLESGQERARQGYGVSNELERASKYLRASASAQTIMEWRTSNG